MIFYLRKYSIFFKSGCPESWILIIHSNTIFVYGNNWNKNQFDEISKSFDFSLFSNYPVSGETSLINQLLEHYKIDNFRIETERLFYRTNSVEAFSNINLEVLLPNEKDVNILAKMLLQYYLEEYEGESKKTFIEMRSKIEEYISGERIYILKNLNGNILSFCTINNPDIGIFFTRKEYRNKGYGKIILSFCSNLLLKRNAEIYLMTMRTKLESNTACKQVGFKQYFEYSSIRINNS
ncbi:MAG: GNAT family N-acetyltransferase [Sphingobacteriales bacterium]|nr:MAG: GNAT family N-acetyltransferase [Sphingobacteriales bacterium]